MEYPSDFGLSESQCKIVQAFWQLDHKEFEASRYKCSILLSHVLLYQQKLSIVLSVIKVIVVHLYSLVTLIQLFDNLNSICVTCK